MPATLTYPGVYIEEIPSGAKIRRDGRTKLSSIRLPIAVGDPFRARTAIVLSKRVFEGDRKHSRVVTGQIGPLAHSGTCEVRQLLQGRVTTLVCARHDR